MTDDYDIPENFEFLDPGPLIDGELELVVNDTQPGDPSRGYVPNYEFEMQVNGKKAGRLGLRVGNTHRLVMYGGHIGYAVEPEFRGRHFAERACRLVLPIAKAHGMKAIWILCDPDNTPSRRTIERLGAEYVETVPVPEEHELYQQGCRQVSRYRLNLG